MGQVILKAVNLRKYFYGRRRRAHSLIPKRTILKAVDGVDIEVKQGQTVAIIGESGCGKTTLGCTLARIYSPTTGEIWFDGEEISTFEKADLKRVRQKMQMVFQDPGSSLNPRHKVEGIISLPLRVHFNLSRGELKRRAIELLELVNLKHEMMGRLPTDLSGGEKQRVGIARALALNPKVIILDEPTSALDVSVQAKILHLLKELQRNLQLTYLLITHNLSLGKVMADEIIVMYMGRIVERAEVNTFFRDPLHPYARALLSAIPVITEEEKRLIPAEIVLEGELPSPECISNHCTFLSRCPEKMSYCKDSPEPVLKGVQSNHYVRCCLY